MNFLPIPLPHPNRVVSCQNNVLMGLSGTDNFSLKGPPTNNFKIQHVQDRYSIGVIGNHYQSIVLVYLDVSHFGVEGFRQDRFR